MILGQNGVEDGNKMMKLEEIRLHTIYSNIVEEKNLTFMNAVCKIYITYFHFFARPEFSHIKQIY